MAEIINAKKRSQSPSYLGAASIGVAVLSFVIVMIGKTVKIMMQSRSSGETIHYFAEFLPVLRYQLFHPEIYQSLYILGIGLGLVAAMQKGRNPILPITGLLSNGLLGFILPFREPILGSLWANLIIGIGIVLACLKKGQVQPPQSTVIPSELDIKEPFRSSSILSPNLIFAIHIFIGLATFAVYFRVNEPNLIFPFLLMSGVIFGLGFLCSRPSPISWKRAFWIHSIGLFISSCLALLGIMTFLSKSILIVAGVVLLGLTVPVVVLSSITLFALTRSKVIESYWNKPFESISEGIVSKSRFMGWIGGVLISFIILSLAGGFTWSKIKSTQNKKKWILSDKAERNSKRQSRNAPYITDIDLDFSPNGKTILGRFETINSKKSFTDILFMWDIESGEKIAALTSTGKIFVAPHKETLMFNWVGYMMLDAETGKLINRIKDGLLGTYIHYSPDGSLLTVDQNIQEEVVEKNKYGQKRHIHKVTGANVLLVDSRTGEIRKKIYRAGGRMSTVGFLNGGKNLLTRSSEGLYFWDVQSGKKIKTLKFKPKIVSISPDEKTFFTKRYAEYSLWNLNTGSLRSKFNHGGKGVHAYLPDGRSFMSYNETMGTIKLWEIKSGKELASFPYKGELWISPNNAVLFGSEDGILRTWNTVKRDTKEIKNPFKIKDLKFFEEKGLAAIIGETSIVLFDYINEQEAYSISFKESLKSISFSNDGERLGVITVDDNLNSTIHILNTMDGKSIKKINYSDYLYSVSFYKDGNMLVGASEKEVLVWNLLSQELVTTIKIGDLRDRKNLKKYPWQADKKS